MKTIHYMEGQNKVAATIIHFSLIGRGGKRSSLSPPPASTRVSSRTPRRGFAATAPAPADPTRVPRPDPVSDGDDMDEDERDFSAGADGGYNTDNFTHFKTSVEESAAEMAARATEAKFNQLLSQQNMAEQVKRQLHELVTCPNFQESLACSLAGSPAVRGATNNMAAEAASAKLSELMGSTDFKSSLTELLKADSGFKDATKEMAASSAAASARAHLQTHVSSPQFLDDLALALATNPSMKQDTCQTAAQAAASKVKEMIDSDAFTTSLAQLVVVHPAITSATAAQATEAAKSSVNNLFQTGELSNAVGAHLLLQESFISNLDNKLQEPIRAFKDSVSAIQTSAVDPETNNLLSSLLEKVGQVAQVQIQVNNLKCEFETMSLMTIDLNQRLVQSDLDEVEEEKNLQSELEEMLQSLDTRTGTLRKELMEKFQLNEEKTMKSIGNAGKDITDIESNLNKHVEYWTRVSKEMKETSKCVLLILYP